MDDAIFRLFLRQIESGRNVVSIPTAHDRQAAAVADMLSDDKTGLIKSILEFQVASAAHKFEILTDNPNYNEILKEWLATINISFNGQAPLGIYGLSDEYYRERWEGASFPIVKITKWESLGGVSAPTGLSIIDGASVKEQDGDYFLGEEELSNNRAVIFTRPFGRYFDTYPSIYAIERGILYNYQLFALMRDHQGRGVGGILFPFLTRVIKGSPELATALVRLGQANPGMFTDEELTKIKEKMQEFADQKIDGGTAPVRATNFDEKIEFLVPDLKPLLDTAITSAFERSILSGLGFIDVIDIASSSRRESVINPKPFIAEVKKGSDDFVRAVLTPLYYKIVEANSSKRYTKTNFTIAHEPVTVFMNDKIKSLLRSLYDRGMLSKRTASELVGEVDASIETKRREEEARTGVDVTMYPPEITNTEQSVSPIEVEKLNQQNVSDDKKGLEAQNFNQASVKVAKYTYTDYPEVLKEYPEKAQHVWINVFNSMFDKHQDEARAYRGAWSATTRYLRTHYKKQGNKYIAK